MIISPCNTNIGITPLSSPIWLAVLRMCSSILINQRTGTFRQSRLHVTMREIALTIPAVYFVGIWARRTSLTFAGVAVEQLSFIAFSGRHGASTFTLEEVDKKSFLTSDASTNRTTSACVKVECFPFPAF